MSGTGPQAGLEGTMAMNDMQRPRAVEARPLTIGALSRATRIPVETLRTWERRYGAPMPVRKPSGHRLYPAAAVEHLRRVGRLLAQGHRPGEILGLSARELDALLSLSEPAPGATPGITGRSPTGEGSPAGTIRELLRATADLDREPLMHELRASWVRLGPLSFLEGVAGAFMVEIGRAWHAKALEVRHEHFASACLSDFLRAVREPYDQRARGPRIVAAMLPGEEHEGGLLIAAALMALRGYRVLYLGASTPIEQIVAEGFGTTTHLRRDDAIGKGLHDGTSWTVALGFPMLREGIGAPLEPGSAWSVAFAVWLGEQANRGGRKHYANWVPFRLAARA